MLGITTIEVVRKIMSEFSKSNGEIKYSKNILSFEDISLNILFDVNKKAKEINFGILYPGATSKGLKIGDSIDKAIDLYGEPQYKSKKSAIWNIFAVFNESDHKISTIRLKKQ